MFYFLPIGVADILAVGSEIFLKGENQVVNCWQAAATIGSFSKIVRDLQQGLCTQPACGVEMTVSVLLMGALKLLNGRLHEW